MNRLTREAVELIKSFEGFRDRPYLDPAGIWTVGYGHVLLPGEPRRAITAAEGEELLLEDLAIAERRVRAHIKAPLNDNQYSALISLAFNAGSAPLTGTLGDRLNAGDVRGASEEFERWVYAGGMKLPGLVRRRIAERELFDTPA